MGRIIEGFWDCSQCGKTMIRGRLKTCPGCGKACDNTTTFYLKDKKNYVSINETKNINKNPDWVCNYCNQLNSDNNNDCSYCGASREETRNYFEEKQYQKQNCDENEINKELTFIERKNNYTSSYDMNFNSKDVYDSKSSNPNNNVITLLKKFGIGLISVLLISLLIFGLVKLFSPKEENITVSSISWKRSIEIERLETFSESDWHLPASVRLKYTKQEISHYDKVVDYYETKTRTVPKEEFSHYEEIIVGYKDLGNGYFEEITKNEAVYKTVWVNETYKEPVYKNVPVYDTRYYYEIDRYVHNRNEVSSGNDKNVYWPDITLGDKEKTSTKTERYYVIGTNLYGEEKNISLSYDEWQILEIGQSVTLEVYIDGSGKIKKEK